MVKTVNKLTKAKLADLQERWQIRNKLLKSLGMPKQTFDQFMEFINGTSRKEKRKEIYNPELETASTNRIPKTTKNLENNSGKLPWKNSIIIPTTSDDQKSRPWKSPPPTAEPAPMYTGTKMIGITVLHKSCLQPVFSQEEAKDAARMRR
jgi:hypothetical protein